MKVSDIPFEDFGGSGEVIHIAHANGFPAACYGQMAKELSVKYKVLGMNARPLWDGSDYKKVRNWYTLAKDLIRFLDEKNLSNIVGVGHSFGSVITMIAANKRPDLFSKLVIIEPVILRKNQQRMVSMAPVPIIKRVAPIIKTAGNRTDLWNSQNEVFAHFRIKPVFSKISDEILWDYVRSATRKTKDGKVQLGYSKDWETQIFATVADTWSEMKKLKKPYLAIRGEESDVLYPSTWNKWKSLASSDRFIELKNVGHLAPFEDPQLVARHILSYLNTKM